VARLIYTAICSLDGYVADDDGNFDWAFPGAEVHAFINDLEREAGTQLYGRKMYEVMAAWETMDTEPGVTPVALDYARIWQAAEKVVYSTTLPQVTTARTTLERSFEADAVRELKRSRDDDIGIGGPDLAVRAFETGLVDECRLFLVPVIIGSGNPALPDGLRFPLELLEDRRFDNGFVYLRYRIAP
jgi:dihydrofolate reductase